MLYLLIVVVLIFNQNVYIFSYKALKPLDLFYTFWFSSAFICIFMLNQILSVHIIVN